MAVPIVLQTAMQWLPTSVEECLSQTGEKLRNQGGVRDVYLQLLLSVMWLWLFKPS
jgi:hypothetical protein